MSSRKNYTTKDKRKILRADRYCPTDYTQKLEDSEADFLFAYRQIFEQADFASHYMDLLSHHDPLFALDAEERSEINQRKNARRRDVTNVSLDTIAKSLTSKRRSRYHSEKIAYVQAVEK